MALDIEIDRDLCMGSGNCVYEAPGTFDLDDDSISYVADASAASAEQILAAARKCPTRAITVRGDAAGETGAVTA